MIGVLLVFIVVVVAIVICKSRKDEKYTLFFPMFRPGHRPGLGDFLPTVGEGGISDGHMLLDSSPTDGVQKMCNKRCLRTCVWQAPWINRYTWGQCKNYCCA